MTFLNIDSNDNTNVMIAIDRIEYVIEEDGYCLIGLCSGETIRTGASFKDIQRVLNGSKRR